MAGNSPWDDSYDGAPPQAYAAEIYTAVQTVRSSLDLVKDFGVVLGDSFWHCSGALDGLACGVAVEISRRDLLIVCILGGC